MNSIISVIICSAFLAGITSCQNEVKKTKSKKRIVQSKNSSNKAITQNGISKKSAKSSKEVFSLFKKLNRNPATRNATKNCNDKILFESNFTLLH